MRDPRLTVTSTLRAPRSTLPKHRDLEAFLRASLGDTYELSIVFVGKTRARSLNQAYRNKSYVPNVLSFPLSKNQGEIFVCPAVAEREAAKFGLSNAQFIKYLIIHGMLHLKGHTHGGTMDKAEAALCDTFGIAHPRH
jgi:probable rRNA maturation factor